VCLVRVEGVGMKIGANKIEHSDKKTRVCPYINPDYYDKIRRLAFVCKTSEAKLANEMLEYCLDHPGFVAWLQDQHKVSRDSRDRITPINEGGKVIY
jgi:hypothetical protein